MISGICYHCREHYEREEVAPRGYCCGECREEAKQAAQFREKWHRENPDYRPGYCAVCDFTRLSAYNHQAVCRSCWMQCTPEERTAWEMIFPPKR